VDSGWFLWVLVLISGWSGNFLRVLVDSGSVIFGWVLVGFEGFWWIPGRSVGFLYSTGGLWLVLVGPDGFRWVLIGCSGFW
jgi:hypothetical protein